MRLERVGRVRELSHLGDSGSLRGGKQKTVVRADEEPALAIREHDGSSDAADTGVDDCEVDARRHVRERAGKDECALEHLRRRDPVRDVDHTRVGRDPGDHPVTRADEVVLEAEVGEEADHHGVESTTVRGRFRPHRRARPDHSSPPRPAPRRPPRARPASSPARSTRRASPTRASRMRWRPTARRARRGRSRASARARAARVR